MDALRIGHSAQQYPEQRNIIGKVPGAEYKLCRDYYSLASRLLGLARISGSPEWVADRPFRFRDFGLNQVDCLHFFNGVSYSRRPWVATFETFIPRFVEVLRNHSGRPEVVQSSPKTRKALDCLASDYCLGLFALSASALELQSQLLNLFPDVKDVILAKTQVLHPPQDPATRDSSQLIYPYERNNELRFMLVGHHFFRKGGMEILRAFDSVRQATGAPLKLCLVSALRSDQYAARADEQDVEWTRQFIKSNADWIEHYPSLPHAQVVEKMAQCDVGLLPSYAETYGYSVLELQSQGRAVITTNVRAFPEINLNQCGWLLPVPKREVGGEAFFRSADERKSLSEAIEQGLIRVLEDIIDNPAQIREKGERALQRILDHHDPENFGKTLEYVYRKAL
jgi:glycosyltransferase involved in cell wall biosynthesis